MDDQQDLSRATNVDASIEYPLSEHYDVPAIPTGLFQIRNLVLHNRTSGPVGQVESW